MSCNVKALRSEGWFSFEWFVRNNTNYISLLDGKYAFKDNPTGRRDDPPPAISPVSAEDL